jgi:hypothetical protein
MKTNTLSKRLAYASLAMCMALLSCNLLTTSVNQNRTESQSVEIKSVTSARVQIDFPAGELTVQDGARSLMDADFQYNVDKWKPQVQYRENGNQGELMVNQPGSDQLPVGGVLVNTWKLLLKNDIPMDLTISTGAGNSNLDLGGLDLLVLEIETGVGTTNIDLDGDWDHDVTASIQGGVGELKVNLPSQMGVRIEMETALVTVNTNGLIVAENGYINKAYGTSPHTLTLKLEAGVGSVALTVAQQ